MARPKMIWTLDALLARTIDDAGCLVWQGRRHHQNHVPLCDHEGRAWTVRRLVLTLLGKPLRPTDFVIATCDTTGCIAPEHLRIRSRSQHLAEVAASPNRNEVVRRARIAATRRQSARLTPEQVAMVRASPESGAELARRLGVNKSLTNRIRRGEAWREEASPWAGMGAR